MTHRPIQVEDDGTRVYADYHRYRPKPLAERVYAVRKPDDPRAVRFGSRWFLPLDVLPDEHRTMPATRPDEDAYAHMDSNLLCRCDVCQRPAAERWRRKWRREHRLRPGPVDRLRA